MVASPLTGARILALFGRTEWILVPVKNPEDSEALDPFLRIIEQGLDGLVDGEHFFDFLADDVVFEYVVTVPDYPSRVEGRDNLVELYRVNPLPVLAALSATVEGQ
jgi:hypothetical protein